MEMTIAVTVQITNDDTTTVAREAELRAAARQAIENAVHRAEDDGFSHSLEASTSIRVLCVEMCD